MNSTKEPEKDRDARAEDFFNHVLVPAAQRERNEGRTFFALRPDAEAESYFVEPTHRALTPADFELRAAESIEDFISELVALWVAEGNGELASMAPQLGALAMQISEEEPPQEDDVSAFMYVMF